MKIHIENTTICSSYTKAKEEKLIVYIMLSLFSWRSGHSDLTLDQRWESMAILFVGGLFKIWNSAFHMYRDQIDLWKILNTHVNMLVQLKLFEY